MTGYSVAPCPVCGMPAGHPCAMVTATDPGPTVTPVPMHAERVPVPMLAGYMAADGRTYCTLNPGAVAAMAVTDPPRSTLGALGYGETGTRYALTLTDGRTRRVYARQYGNAGTLGVYVRGAWASLATDTEYALADLRDGVTR